MLAAGCACTAARSSAVAAVAAPAAAIGVVVVIVLRVSALTATFTARRLLGRLGGWLAAASSIGPRLGGAGIRRHLTIRVGVGGCVWSRPVEWALAPAATMWASAFVHAAMMEWCW